MSTNRIFHRRLCSGSATKGVSIFPVFWLSKVSILLPEYRPVSDLEVSGEAVRWIACHASSDIGPLIFLSLRFPKVASSSRLSCHLRCSVHFRPSIHSLMTFLRSSSLCRRHIESPASETTSYSSFICISVGKLLMEWSWQLSRFYFMFALVILLMDIAWCSFFYESSIGIPWGMGKLSVWMKPCEKETSRLLSTKTSNILLVDSLGHETVHNTVARLIPLT